MKIKTKKQPPFSLAPIVVEILFIFLKMKRLKRKAGIAFTNKARAIRYNKLETLNVKLETKDYFCKKITLVNYLSVENIHIIH